jgi:hypothetical protein
MFGLNTYYKRKKLEIDIEMQKYRSEMLKGVQELTLECAKQREVDNLNAIIKEKNEEIAKLNSICLEFAKNVYLYLCINK